ncbi:MAG: nitronate monooxygenase [Ignavibacteriaceae bacterium]|nr:nitronate monooxygenase [Ignavibacteriaceae bacterium]
MAIENMMNWKIISGGMGVGVSSPRLANVVSKMGGLGTLSGVAADRWLARMLQHGDPDGKIRAALSHFPFRETAKRIIDTFFVDGGLAENQAYKVLPVFTFKTPKILIDLTVCANFVLVMLAKEACASPVNINYLEKIQLPHVYSFAGAMLAGVDYITMGAGIPIQVPGILDSLAEGKPACYRINVDGRTEPAVQKFDLAEHFKEEIPKLKRPGFFPIISSNLLADLFMTKSSGSIEGFIVELPTAGGHNAAPRGKFPLNENGEPVYGPKDVIDFEKIAKHNKPFWIGGSYASPSHIKYAQSLGANGVQVGTIFALSEESGILKVYKDQIRKLAFNNQLIVKTDLLASPTGFPFKVIQLPGTLSEAAVYDARTRICNQGFLTTPYERPDGIIGFRCASERFDQFVRKGGKIEETAERRCLCNGLIAGSEMTNPGEPPILTLGDDTSFLKHLMKHEDDTYTAADAMNYLLSEETPA